MKQNTENQCNTTADNVNISNIKNRKINQAEVDKINYITTNNSVYKIACCAGYKKSTDNDQRSVIRNLGDLYKKVNKSYAKYNTKENKKKLPPF